jgi:hypothetical protein
MEGKMPITRRALISGAAASALTPRAHAEAGSNSPFVSDLYVFKKSRTATMTTEVHVLSAAKMYQEFRWHSGTALDMTDDSWTLLAGPHVEVSLNEQGGQITDVDLPNQLGDLVAIKKWGTGTQTTEVHILPAEKRYKEFSWQSGTALEMTDNNWAFATFVGGDLWAIKKNGTGTGTTELHLLSAQSRYRDFVFHKATALEMTDMRWEFGLANNLDLFAIKKSGTGTNSTEVHVLSAEKDYKDFSLHTGTPLEMTDETWAFVVAANRDVVAIKKGSNSKPTGSGRTEVHILSAAKGYQEFSLHTATPVEMTDETFEFRISTGQLIVTPLPPSPSAPVFPE